MHFLSLALLSLYIYMYDLYTFLTLSLSPYLSERFLIFDTPKFDTENLESL